MNFADSYFVLLKEANGGLRFLELDSQMTRVIGHAQMLREPRVISMFCAQSIKEMDHLAGGLEKTHGLGFKAEVQAAARLAADAGDVLDATPEIIANDP